MIDILIRITAGLFILVSTGLFLFWPGVLKTLIWDLFKEKKYKETDHDSRLTKAYAKTKHNTFWGDIQLNWVLLLLLGAISYLLGLLALY